MSVLQPTAFTFLEKQRLEIWGFGYNTHTHTKTHMVPLADKQKQGKLLSRVKSQEEDLNENQFKKTQFSRGKIFFITLLVFQKL